MRTRLPTYISPPLSTHNQGSQPVRYRGEDAKARGCHVSDVSPGAVIRLEFETRCVWSHHDARDWWGGSGTLVFREASICCQRRSSFGFFARGDICVSNLLSLLASSRRFGDADGGWVWCGDRVMDLSLTCVYPEHALSLQAFRDAIST